MSLTSLLLQTEGLDEDMGLWATTDNLHRLPKITLFHPDLFIFEGNSVDKYTRGTTRALYGLLGLYGIYRLAINQLNFLKPGLYELVNNDLFFWSQAEHKTDLCCFEKESNFF